MTDDADAPSKPPGLIGTRHRQISILFFGLVISYFQRVNLSVGLVAMTSPSNNSDIPFCVYSEADPFAAQEVRRKHHLSFLLLCGFVISLFRTLQYSTYQKGLLSSIFYWGYLISGLPAGYLADKYGPVRLVAIVGGILCGFMTILFPFAAVNWSFETVCATRVLQGVGQGVFYPSTQAFLSKWAIPQERENFSWVWSGCQLGTIIMMPLGGLIALTSGGWPAIFYVSGGVAVAWGLFCLIFGADSPNLHKSISKEEKDYIQFNFQASSKKGKNMKIPYKQIATSIPVWAIIINQSCENWGFAILITLMPTYLTGVYGFDIAKNGFLSALPYAAMFVCAYLFSYLGSHLRVITSVNFNRKFWNSVALYGTAVTLALLAFINANATVALVLLTLANGLDAGVYAGYLSNHLDLAPNYAGFLLGLSNALGNIPSIISPTWAGYVVEDEHSMDQWQIVFLVTAVIKFVGNTIFIIFGSTKIQSWNDSVS